MDKRIEGESTGVCRRLTAPRARALRLGVLGSGLLEVVLGPVLGLGTARSAPPAKADETLDVDAAARDKMMACTDGKSHYVLVGPHEQVSHALYYGDGKRFYFVPGESHGMLPGTSFLDPRYFNKTANSNFHGLDVRLYSEVEIDAEKQTCAVHCGTRTTPLTFLPADKARELAKAASFAPSPRKYVPYGLARDDRGTYYYVDHGATEKSEKDFRLFVGQRGSMKLMKMTNVVSDSEGDIFTTPSGSLRLILDKQRSSWIEGQKSSDLKVVPVNMNLQVIYNDLGVYVGQRLGTPCDDL
jgi:hypothetical protein